MCNAYQCIPCRRMIDPGSWFYFLRTNLKIYKIHFTRLNILHEYPLPYDSVDDDGDELDYNWNAQREEKN
jgi:hypothetical protein